MPQDIETAIENDPRFQQLLDDTPEEDGGEEEEPQRQDVLSGQEYDPKDLLRWWETSEYSLDALTLDQLQNLYEDSNNTVVTRYKWLESDSFSVSHLAISDKLSQTAELDSGITLTFESLPFDVARSVEAEIFDYAKEGVGASAYRMGSMRKVLPHSWIAMNGVRTEQIARDRYGEEADGISDHDARALLVERMPLEFIEQVAVVFGEFRRRSTALVMGSLSGN